MKRFIFLLSAFTGLLIWVGCASQELTSAKLYIQQENWDKAEEFLVKALDTEPNNPEVPYLLGDLVYGKRADWIDMDAMYKKAMKLGPDKVILEQGLTVKKYVEQSREKYWVEEYNKGVKNFNDYRNAPTDDKGKFLDNAIQALNNAVIIKPDQMKSFTLLGTCYFQSGDTTKAVELAKKAANESPDEVEANLNAGKILYNAKDKEGAVTYFKKVIELDPSNRSAIRNLAQIYYDLNKLDLSIETFHQAIKQETDRKIKADLYFNLGLLYMKVNDFTQAEDNFNMAYDLNPNDPEALTGVARAFEGAEKWSKAEKFYRQLTIDDPDNPDHYKSLARVLIKQGKMDEATHYYQKGKDLEANQ